jgi:glycosyltransferase involved in cell wall biosynthesis
VERPLRILHLTAHSEPGGLSRYIFDLSLAMHGLGHDVRVAGGRGSWHWLFDRAPFPSVEFPLDQGPLKMWQATRALRRYLAQHPVDVIHTHYRRTTLVARRIQPARGRPPILYTIHLSDIPMHWRARLFPDYGDHVHVASAQARRWAIDTAGVDAGRITTIPHGIDVRRFPVPTDAERRAARQRLGVSPVDRVAVFVGRLDSPKNEHWLLDVANQSRAAIPNLRILIAGKGPHEAGLRQQIATWDLGDRVRLVGEFEDPLPVYHAADALLLPSEREGFSLACAEAMSAGVPVCRTRTAGSSELIIEGLTGVTTDIDRGAFVAGAIAFLRDGDALARMSPAAAARIRAGFTFERQLAATIALYRQLAGQPETADLPVAAAPAGAAR